MAVLNRKIRTKRREEENDGRAFLVAQLIKNPCAMQETTCSPGDPGLLPGSERSPGEGNATHSTILAWEIPWTEEPGGLQSMGLQRVRHY